LANGSNHKRMISKFRRTAW